jgi:DNA invertase Pin-like site-specific DNA recombinase
MKPLSPPYVPISARRAVAYLRVSSHKQGASIAQQRRAIELYAAKHGFVIVKWYIDEAISGASVDGRRAFEQLQLDGHAPGRDWQYVLVYDVSRFSRGDIDQAGHLRYEFRLVGVEVIYCNENLTGGDADDLVVGVKQWMAQRFVVDLSRVTLRGQLTLSASGAWCGGAPGYGYDLLYADSSGRPYQRVRWLENGDKEIYDAAGKLTRILPRGAHRYDPEDLPGVRQRTGLPGHR